MDILAAEFELTTRCNQKCRICVRSMSTVSRVDMDLKWIRNCHNYKTVSLVGPRSEPTLHPQFIDILEIFKNKKITISLYSNTTTHTPEWWHKVGKTMSEGDMLIFAIDLEKHWEIYRGTNNWHKMIENVKAFTDAGGRAWAHMIEFQHNSCDKEKTTQLAQELGCEKFRVKSSWNYDDICKRPRTNTKTRWEQGQELKGTELKCGHILNNKVTIDVYGDITPCCFTIMTELKKKILENSDWKHRVIHAGCAERGDLKTVEKATESKLFDYILTNKEELQNCTLHCKVGYEECTYSDDRQLKVVDAGDQKRIENKMWIIDELIKIHFLPTDYYNILTVGGWNGQMNSLLLPYVTSKLLTTDLDPECTKVCKQLGLEAETIDMFDIDYDPWDIIINTSCEHIDFVKWIEPLKCFDKYMVLQSTNMPWLDHVNTVDNLEQFKKQAGLSEIWYEGERRMNYYKYKRFMLIGVK